MDFDFNQEIDYQDSTFDVNFENARKWAVAHNAHLAEVVEKRHKVSRDIPYTEEVYTEVPDGKGGYTGMQKTVVKVKTVEELWRVFKIVANDEEVA